MRTFVKIILILFATHASFGQQTLLGGSENVGVTYGNQLFDAGNYEDALEVYSQAVSGDSNKDILLKIGDCYRAMNNHEQAELWYKEGLDGNEIADPEYKLKLAQSLTTNEKYDEARDWYQKYRSDKPSSALAKNKLEGLSHLDWFYYDTLVYDIEPVSISSGRSEFAPSWYKDGLVYVATNQKGKNVNYNSNYDLYYTKINSDKTLSSPVKFEKGFNSKYQEGPIAFFNDYQEAIFTRTNINGGKAQSNSNNVAVLELYSAIKDGNKWTKIKRLPFCDDSYSSGHPALSEDGLTMVYASNKPGGYGGTDLYISKFEKGHWQEGTNLSSSINTSGNEMFPTLYKGILYFSSNGLEGLGGLDVYKIRLDELKEGIPLNLGFPINTSKDDFGIVYEDNWKGGYVSSDRDGGKGQDDIYHFIINIPKTLKLQGDLKDLNDKAYKNVNVTVLEGGKVISSGKSDATGHFDLDVPYGEHEYELKFEDNAFGSKSEIVKVDSSTFSLRPLIFEFEEQLMYSGTLKDDNSNNPVAGASIVMTEKKTGKVLKTMSDERGYFQLPVEEGNSYELLITKRSFFTIRSDVFISDKVLNDDLLSYKFKKIEVGKAIKLENIYYNVNSDVIREDAKPGLNYLVKILKDNPGMKIELNSHTDTRGSSTANMTLSQKRAESAVEYITQNGISRDRMVAKGYGESLPLNKCKNGVTCTDEEHQINRRTEFKVIDF